MADEKDLSQQRDRENQDPQRDENQERSQRGSGQESERDLGTRDRGVERSDWSDTPEKEQTGKRADEDLDLDDR